MITTDFRSLPPAAQEDIRRKAVNAVLGGMNKTLAAKTFGVTRQAISKWCRLYEQNGQNGLVAKPRGAPKRHGLLKPTQCAFVVKAITQKNPDQLCLPGFWLWTRNAVLELVKSKFGIHLSLSSVGRLLRRCGMTPQKPAKMAYQRNDQACKDWVENTYPAIKSEAKCKGATIYWGDECGFRSDHQCGTTYGLRGQTPVVKHPGNRFSCNMISAVNNRGRMYFKMYDGTFTSDIFIEFMRRLVKQNKHKVFLIVDNLSTHTSAKVKKWVNKNAKNIQLFFLPKYSPDLNPTEYLNNDVKSNAVGRCRAMNKAELKKNIISRMRSTQKRPKLVKMYFEERHVRYARA